MGQTTSARHAVFETESLSECALPGAGACRRYINLGVVLWQGDWLNKRFYNPARRHSTLGYLNPMDFEKLVQVA